MKEWLKMENKEEKKTATTTTCWKEHLINSVPVHWIC